MNDKIRSPTASFFVTMTPGDDVSESVPTLGSSAINGPDTFQSGHGVHKMTSFLATSFNSVLSWSVSLDFESVCTDGPADADGGLRAAPRASACDFEADN